MGPERDHAVTPEASPETSHLPADHAPGGRSGRVLICDDTEQIRRLIRVNLELEGYEVVEAVDGPAALEILHDTTQPLPDVITLDVVMPRKDGWWTVSTIRADPRLAHIPIVMVTASAQNTDRARAEFAHVNEFLAKPFDPDELLYKIAALTRAPSSTGAGRSRGSRGSGASRGSGGFGDLYVADGVEPARASP